MSFSFLNKTKSQVDEALIKRVVNKFLTVYHLTDRSVAVIIVTDVGIRDLNLTFRRRDKITDVLSFSELDSDQGDPSYLGEIFIDFQQIKRQAKIYGNTIEYELVFILVHGLLHLIGYDDRTRPESDEMKRLGTEFVAQYFKAIAKANPSNNRQ